MKIFILISLTVCALHSNAQIFDITDFGAVGNGSTMNTIAIQSAIDSCHNAGGGIVRAAGGNFLTATVFLKSNVTIQIDSGATITGSPNTIDYPDVIPQIRSYTDNYTQRSVFYAEGQHNIGITGKGTFHGNGISANFLLNAGDKPYGFRFISCSNVRYEDVTLLNSGFWMMHNQDIDTLFIKNVKITNQNLGNGDGIGIDGCKHVIVDSCFANCNDDPIVVKTTSLSSSEDISISNCTVMTYSRAIKLGTETHGAFRNIHISNITVILSTTAAIPAKCGINLSVVDGGSMENVLIENVTMTGIKVPILIRLGNRGRKYTDTANTPGVGFLRNVELRNITATASTNVTSSITGIPGYYAKGIRLRNIAITFPGGQSAVSSGFIVPENINSGPEATIFGDTLPAGGLYVRHVDSIQFCNVHFYAQQPDARLDYVFDDVLNIDSSEVCDISAIEYIDYYRRDINVNPNPVAMGNWLLETGVEWVEGKVLVVDITGKVLQSVTITDSRTAIAADDFKSGIYFAIGVKNMQKFFVKLIKQ